MEAGKDNFMQEVRDNFLLCRLCNKEFDKPKALPCMHTFCHGCLVKYADQGSEENRHSYRYSTYCKPISCPVCRRRTDITKSDVDSLPDNFLITSLTGIMNDKTAKSNTCEICTRRSKAGNHSGEGRLAAATHRCLDCDKQMCKRCVAQHASVKVTQHHSLYSLDASEKLMCNEHTEEAVRFICRTCSKCVCIFCTYTDHKSCDLISITEGSANYKQEMEETVETCRQRMQTINSRLGFIQAWEKCYNQTRDHILTSATGFLSQIEIQRQAFLSRLDVLYGPEVLQLLGKKDELIENLEGLSSLLKLSSACKFKENVNDGHSIEALLVQSELQNKVKQLLDTPLPVTDTLISTDEINISFKKGGVNLGCLVKQTEGAEPEYISEITDNDTDSIWCRKCRSRSQSRFKETQSDLESAISHSLKKYISDTDVSLTDISALDNNSSMGDAENPLIAVVSTSLSSDLDTIYPECSDFEVQVDFSLPHITRTTETQYIPEDFQDTTDFVFGEEESKYVTSTHAEKSKSSADTRHINTVDSSSMTEPGVFVAMSDEKQYHDQFAQYHLQTDTVDNGNDPFTLDCVRDQYVQHDVEASDAFTQADYQTCDSYTETDTVLHCETGSQASCSMADAGSYTEFHGKEVETETDQPDFSNAFVQCDAISSQESQTITQAVQTCSVKTVDCFTNTEQKLTQDKSVGKVVLQMHRAISTEKFEGHDMSSQTLSVSTQDRSVGSQSYWACRTQETQCSTLVETMDFSSNTVTLKGHDVSCGSDLPIDNFTSVSTATDVVTKRHVALSVSPLSRAVGTSPIPRQLHNRACGTERPGIRHVALTVRPKVSHRATDPMPIQAATIGCGEAGWRTNDVGVTVHPSESNQASDTADLITLADNSTSSTDLMIGPSVQCQTNKVNTANNFTMMIEALLVDKCTNTPNQLPEERLQTFKRTQSVESVSRCVFH